jgi:hypothetical protein
LALKCEAVPDLGDCFREPSEHREVVAGEVTDPDPLLGG